MEEVRDGQPHFLLRDPKTLTSYHISHDPSTTKRDQELVQGKIVLMQRKNYIGPSKVSSILHYFYVFKGPNDVCIVQNVTGCGLNEVIWAPNLGLPHITHMLHSLVPGYYQCDFDIEEIF